MKGSQLGELFMAIFASAQALPKSKRSFHQLAFLLEVGYKFIGSGTCIFTRYPASGIGQVQIILRSIR